MAIRACRRYRLDIGDLCVLPPQSPRPSRSSSNWLQVSARCQLWINRCRNVYKLCLIDRPPFAEYPEHLKISRIRWPMPPLGIANKFKRFRFNNSQLATQPSSVINANSISSDVDGDEDGDADGVSDCDGDTDSVSHCDCICICATFLLISQLEVVNSFLIVY